MSFVSSQPRKFPVMWKVKPFDDSFFDMTGGNIKIQTRDCRQVGMLPIIDQGQSTVAGYVDDVSLACKAPLPCILFGDHTRTFKYVEYPFALGADGVKVLVPRPGLDARFAFHYLQTVRLPEDLGYSRHFKYLREAPVPQPPIAEQRRIADILDKADAIRRKRKEALALTDELLRATFLEMFGDPVTNPKRWPLATLNTLLAIPPRNGLSPSTSGKITKKLLTLSAITRGRFDPTATKYGQFVDIPAPEKLVTPGELLICRGNGNLSMVGTGEFASEDAVGAIFPDTMIAVRPDSGKITCEYLSAIWKTSFVRVQIESRARTTNGTYKINQYAVENIKIPIPSMSVQLRFSVLFKRLAEMHDVSMDSVDSIESLFSSLQQRAFRGEL